MGATFICRFSIKDDHVQNAFRRVIHEDFCSQYDGTPESFPEDGYGYSESALEWIEHGFKIDSEARPRTLDELRDLYDESYEGRPGHWPEVDLDFEDGAAGGKWGPAIAVPISPKGWFFYGWVSC